MKSKPHRRRREASEEGVDEKIHVENCCSFVCVCLAVRMGECMDCLVYEVSDGKGARGLDIVCVCGFVFWAF